MRRKIGKIGGECCKPWCVQADKAIVTHLYMSRTISGELSIQSPRVIALNIDYSRTHISNRLGVLADHDLVERTGEGAYRLSEYGETIAEENLDVG